MNQYILLIIGFALAVMTFILIYCIANFFNINIKQNKWNSLIIISIIVIGLIVGSLFMRSFQISYKSGDILIVKDITIRDLVFGNDAGTSPHIFYLLLYFVFPLIAALCLIFARFKKNLAVISLLFFLLCGVIAIVSKDVYPSALRYFLKNTTGIKYNIEISAIYFGYFLPIIYNFVGFIATLIILTSRTVFSIRDITEMGVLIAAAFGLSFVKFMPMPTGGSVNLQMLPLFILAIRRGPVKAFVAGGIVYGLITCLTDGYGFACFPFDYLLGFGSIAVFGMFTNCLLKDKKGYSVKGELILLVAGLISTFIRFIGGTISSMVVYGYNFVAAGTYNALYIFVSGLLALAIVMVLYGPIARVNARFPINQTFAEEK